MIRFVLDTDTVSLLQHGHQTVSTHVTRYGPDEVGTTVISVEEQLSAWYTLLRRARTARQLVPVYERMTLAVRFLSRLPLLSFSERAADLYERLRKEKPRTGRMDLRIAAIALANGAALVTRNVSDFTDIDGLQLVDWSRP